MRLLRKLGDIVTNPATGRISMTKLAAATAHLNAAGWFAYLTYRHGFVADLWLIYLGATIFHSGYDKTVAAVRDIKAGQKAPEEPLQP